MHVVGVKERELKEWVGGLREIHVAYNVADPTFKSHTSSHISVSPKQKWVPLVVYHNA